MRDKREFDAVLRSIDGKDPSQYAALSGDFDFTRFVLHNLRVPEYAGGPIETLFVLHVPQIIAGFPPRLFDSPVRRTALEDCLTRKVSDALERQMLRSGDGFARNSLAIARPGAEILPRSALIVAHDYVEARITVRLPVRDGLIHAREAEKIFFEDLPAVVNSALIYCYLDEREVARFIHAMEDADSLRQALAKRGLVGFAADGARLGPDLVLSVPDERAVEIEVPNAGRVKGLGIPAGVTLLVGDPYSGRTELVNALAMGIYNHAPGDGREFVVAVPDAVQVVAEAHRPVQCVDVSPFLAPTEGQDTRTFTSAAARPGESQMATMMEALQLGAQALFLDEALSDPAFLAAGSGMADLSPGAAPRLVPLAERARKISTELRASILVGACACAPEFLPAADTVLCIRDGRIADVTREAKDLPTPPPRKGATLPPLPAIAERSRWIVPSSLDSAHGREDALIRAPCRTQLQFGRSAIDLAGVPQLADVGQTTTIGLILYYAKLHYLDESRSVAEVLDLIDQDLGSEGLDTLSRDLRGDLARPRRFEIAAALNRLNTLRIVAKNPKPA